jgi:hypothetical protein
VRGRGMEKEGVVTKTVESKLLKVEMLSTVTIESGWCANHQSFPY